MTVLISVIVGFICAILGYILGKLSSKGKGTTDKIVNINVYKNRIAKLEADLEACKANKKSTFSGGNSPTKAPETASFTKNPTTPITFDKAAAKAVFGKSIKQDDLTVVEGIGPKIKDLFHNHNINTWASLAECSIEKCQEVLKSGGKRFEIHKPGTWPKQAKFAASGEWQKLKDWQSTLNGGK